MDDPPTPISGYVTLEIIRSPKFKTEPHKPVFLSGGGFVKFRNIDVSFHSDPQADRGQGVHHEDLR